MAKSIKNINGGGAKRVKELKALFEQNGLQIKEVTKNKSGHLRIIFENNSGTQGLVFTGSTPGNAQSDKHLVSDAKMAIRKIEDPSYCHS